MFETEEKDVEELLLVVISDLKEFCEEGLQNGKSTGKITKKTSNKKLELLDDLTAELKKFRDSLKEGWQKREITEKLIPAVLQVRTKLYSIRQNKVNADNYIFDSKLDAGLVEKEIPLLLKEIIILENRANSYIKEYGKVAA